MSNIFNDIGFSPEEAKLLEFKSKILILIEELVKNNKVSRRSLEKILDVPQSRVSDLMTGKIDKMRVDTLLGHLFKLAYHLEVNIKIDLAA